MNGKKLISAMSVLSLLVSTAVMPKTFAEENEYLLVSENFDNPLYEGMSLNLVNSEWVVRNSNEGDSVTVEKDPVSGSMAAKITQKLYEKKQTSNPETGFEIPIPTVNEGIVETSFKIRCDSPTSVLGRSFLFDSDNNRCATFYQYGKSIFAEGMGNYLIDLSADKYVNFVITHDMTNNKYSVKYSNGGKEYTYSQDKEIKDISVLKFIISANWQDTSEGFIDQTSGVAPVYWVDDISVKIKSLEISKTEISGNDFYVTFNEEPADMYVNGEWFEMYCANDKMNNYSVVKSENDAKTVIVSLNSIDAYGEKYTLNVKKGICGVNSALKALSSDFSKTVVIKAPNVIAKDNFESYTEGTKLSEINTGWTINDSKDGDSVTIETDTKNNTKAVKFTQTQQNPAQSGNPYTGFKVNFPTQTSGIVEMKFKVRTDMQTALLNPELVSGGGGFANAAVYIYQTTGDVYFDRSWAKYIGKKLLSDTYADFDIIFNLDDKKVTINGKESSYKVSEISSLNFQIASNYGEGGENWMTGSGAPVYWVDDIAIEKKCIEITNISNSGREFYVDFDTEPDDSILTNEFFKIYSKGSELSGLTIAKDGINSNRVVLSLQNAAEYDVDYTVRVNRGIKSANSSYMDSFTDTEKQFTIKSQNELVNENFNDIENIASAHADWNVKEVNGGTVTVDKDPTTGNAALKIVNPQGNMSENGITIPFESKKTGKVKISYKLRTDNNSSLLTGFSATGSDDCNRITYLQYKNDLYLYGAIKWQDYKFAAIGDKYQKIDITVDLDNGTYIAAVDGVVMFHDVPLSNVDTTKDLAKVKFLISDNYNAWGASESFKTGLTGAGVYWIDDLSIYSYTYPEIVDSSVANGAENVTCDSALTYRFDRDIARVDSSNVHIYKNGMLMEDNEYSLTYQDRVVTLEISEGLQYATDYEVVFDNTIESVTGERCKDSYICKFTTEENPEVILKAEAVNSNGVVIEDLAEYRGAKVVVNAEINPNLNGYTFIAALKDGNGVIKDLAMINSEKVENNRIELNLDVPEDADENYVLEGFLWDSVSQKPLREKLDIVKKNSNLKIYVAIAAENGGDGSKEHPFNNLTEARNYARTNKTHNRKSEIIIKSGRYILEDTFALGEEDDYTLYRAYGNDAPVLAGGDILSIDDFAVADDDRIKDELKGKIYKINLIQKGIDAPKLNIKGHSTEELKNAGFSVGNTDSIVVANGEMLYPARYPNDGYMTVKTVLQNGNAANKLAMKFSVDNDDTSRWNGKNAMVFGYWYYDWSDQSAPVASVENGVITTTVPSGYGIREGQRFYIYNLLEELDAPGEWYYDKDTGNFFIYPPQNCSEITICGKSYNIINISGAESIELRGLKIENSGYAGVSIGKSKYITVSNCEVKNTAGSGIQAYGNNIKILKNIIHSVGTSGIGTGGGNTENLKACANIIQENEVYDTAKIVTRYTPSLRIEGVGVRAENNKLYNAPHCAVIFGGNDHIIAQNEIYNVLRDSSDSGAIYSGRSMVRRGTQIAGNYIHDLKTSSDFGFIYGIYLDDCMSGVSVNKNRFENISGTGIFINGGRNNEAEGNSFNKVDCGIELSNAGMTDWYGNDEKFIATMGLSDGLYKSAPYLKYPGLYNILEDDFRMPKYNIIKGNEYSDCTDGTVIKIFDKVTSENTIRNINTVE